MNIATQSAPVSNPTNAQLLRCSTRSITTLRRVAGWSSMSFFFFLYRLGKFWNVIFSPFRKQTFKKVTRNEHFVEWLWNLTSLGPDTDPADILYRNQRWRIQISTCGDSPLADGGRLTRSGAAGGGSSAETGLWGSRSGPSGTRWAPTG